MRPAMCFNGGGGNSLNDEAVWVAGAHRERFERRRRTTARSSSRSKLGGAAVEMVGR
jgi:hypothetical protein